LHVEPGKQVLVQILLGERPFEALDVGALVGLPG